MTKIELQLKEDVTEEQARKYIQIFMLLITKGALDGVKGGKAIIHFDGSGMFQGIQLDYWPFRVRKEDCK